MTAAPTAAAPAPARRLPAHGPSSDPRTQRPPCDTQARPVDPSSPLTTNHRTRGGRDPSWTARLEGVEVDLVHPTG